jgi:hypothetical protein
LERGNIPSHPNNFGGLCISISGDKERNDCLYGMERERERQCCLGVVFHEKSGEGTIIGLCMVK